MAGKPKNATWGGKRENQTGRPRKIKTVSEKIKLNYQKAALKLAKEHGISIEMQLLSMVYSDDVQDTVKASIMKSYNDAMISKEIEQNINVNKVDGPAIELPAVRGEDPALKLVKG